MGMAASSFYKQSRNTDPLLSPMDNPSVKKQFVTQDAKHVPSTIDKQYSEQQRDSRLPPSAQYHRKESKSRANVYNFDKPSARGSASKIARTNEILEQQINDKSRNMDRASVIQSANTQLLNVKNDISIKSNKEREHKSQSRMRLSSANDFAPTMANNILTPQNQTQPLVSSTGGSFDHKQKQSADAKSTDQKAKPKFQSALESQIQIPNPLKNFEEAKFASKSHGLIVSYAANTHQGIQRTYNEDRVSIILNMTKPVNKKSINYWPKCSYFAIYDGHGGSACADFLKDCLHQIIINQECFPQNPAQALTNGCLAAEAQFISMADQVGRHDKSGSCAIIVLIVEQNCYVANVGDSRAIMSAEEGQKLFVLSRDHRPNEDTEKQRITENGGKIYQTQTYHTVSPQNAGNGPTLFPSQQMILGPFRGKYSYLNLSVLPGRLSVSRTFGDIEAKLEKYGGKQGVVIAQPEIAQFAIADDTHDFIVLGCDGIFDRLNNLQVQDLAWKTIEQAKASGQNLTVHQVCGKVVDAILQLAAIEKSFDNLTIVMVAFKNLQDYINKKDVDGSNYKNIKIHEEEQPPGLNTQPVAQTLTPQDRNKKILLEKLIQSKRDQKYSSRGKSQNPYTADTTAEKSPSPFRQEEVDSALPALKSNKQPQFGLQSSFATIQSRKSTRNKFLSNNSNAQYQSQEQPSGDKSQSNQTPLQVVNSRNRALASFYNSEKVNNQQTEIQNQYRKSRQGLTHFTQSTNLETEVRPKSNSRNSKNNLVIDAKKQAAQYVSGGGNQTEVAPSSTKYGSFQYQNSRQNMVSSLISQNFTPKTYHGNSIIGNSGVGQLAGQSIGGPTVETRQSFVFDRNKPGPAIVSSPDKKKKLPQLKANKVEDYSRTKQPKK